MGLVDGEGHENRTWRMSRGLGLQAQGIRRR